MNQISRITTAFAIAVLLSGIPTTTAAQSPPAGESPPTSIGFAVTRRCQTGTCPPTSAQPMGTTVELPLDFTYTVASGDRFHVTGTYESRNARCPGPNASASRFVVEYLGNGGEEPSQDDVLGFDAYTTFACMPATGTPGTMLLFGRFSPDIAPTSDASGIENMNGTPTAVFGGLAPPGIFSQTRQGVTTITIKDSFALRESMLAHFGAGSPVGSYIAFGGHPAPGAEAPNLATPLPSIQFIQSDDQTLYLLVANSRWTLSPVHVFSTQINTLPPPTGTLSGDIPPSLLVQQPAANEVVVFRTPDSTLYVQQGDKVWTLVPTQVGDDVLSAYDLIGSLDGVVPPDVLMLDPTE